MTLAFDFEAATKERNLAIDLAASGASDKIKAEIREAVLRVAGERVDFTTADVIVALGDRYRDITEPRVLGAIVKQLSSEGLIVPTGTYRTSGLRRNHNRVMCVWRRAQP